MGQLADGSPAEHKTKLLAVTLWQVLCCSLQVSLGVPATAPGKVCGWHSLWVNGTQETEPSTRLHLSGTSLVTSFLQLDAYTYVKAENDVPVGQQPTLLHPCCVGVPLKLLALAPAFPGAGAVERPCSGVSPRCPGGRPDGSEEAEVCALQAGRLRAVFPLGQAFSQSTLLPASC